MPAGEYLGESFHRAGGVPAVLKELLQAGKLRGDALTVNGRTMAENLKNVGEPDRKVIRSYGKPLLTEAGFAVLSGSLFDAAIMKTSVISPAFRKKSLEQPNDPEDRKSKRLKSSN